MREPTPPPGPPPTRSRVALLTGGLLLLIAGVALVAWILASAAGLVGGNDDPTMAAPGTTAAPGEAAGTVDYRLEPADGDPVTVRLEVAADPASRARGLMEREQVPPGTGMVFLYDEPSTGRYWMHDVTIPLRAVFVRDGRVVSTVVMPPCGLDDPSACPTYGADGPYDTVVETAPETLPDVQPGDPFQLLG